MTPPIHIISMPVDEYGRLIEVCNGLIGELSDPGTEALAAVYCAERILHTALTAAPVREEGGAVRAWMFRESPSERWHVTMDRQHVDEYLKAFSTAEVHPLAIAAREEAPERRVCDECGFKGTSDDASKEQDYCTACGGNSPAGGPDECAHCGAKNHMVMSCPKCGGRFSLDEDAREEAPAEDDARRKLIQCIEQWDGETEYDADDLTSLADSILHAFNGPPVVLRADPVQLSSNPCQLAVATSSEASPCPFCGCGMRVNYDPESEMYGPDGDHLPGCIIGNWDLHEYAFRPDALAAWNSRALRAQPPAREDAQRVGKPAPFDQGGIGHAMYQAFHAYHADYVLSTDGADYETTPFERDLIEDFFAGLMAEEAFFGPVRALYDTHPAPDALRVAVEALEALAGEEGDCGEKVYVPCTWKPFREVARQALATLAALQAEQEGGVR